MEFMCEDNFRSISDRTTRFMSFCHNMLIENDLSCDKEVIYIVKNMNLRQQKELFINIYEDHKLDILKGHQNTEWIIGSELIMNVEDYDIDLTKVYNCCCKLSSLNNRLIQKYKNVSNEKKYEVFYPKIFLYIFYSCLEFFVPKEDRQRIREIAEEVKIFISNLGNVDNGSSNNEGFSGFSKVLEGVFSVFTQNSRMASVIKKSKIPIDSIIKDVSGALNNSNQNTDYLSVINTIIDKMPISEGLFEDEQETTEEPREKSAPEVQKIEVSEEPSEVFDL